MVSFGLFVSYRPIRVLNHYTHQTTASCSSCLCQSANVRLCLASVSCAASTLRTLFLPEGSCLPLITVLELCQSLMSQITHHTHTHTHEHAHTHLRTQTHTNIHTSCLLIAFIHLQVCLCVWVCVCVCECVCALMRVCVCVGVMCVCVCVLV